MRSWTYVTTFAGVTMLSIMALADGYRNPPEGAAALGRGGARYVFMDDLTVVTHNPANLAEVDKAAVTPSVTFTYGPVDYTAPDGTTESTDTSVGMIPSFYGALPIGDGRCVLGLGINSPYGQSTEWDAGGLFTGLAPYYAQLTTVNANPALGFRLTDNLWVGAGLDLLYGKLEFRQAMPGMPLPDGSMAPGSRLLFDADGTAVGGNMGVTLCLGESQRVALSYRTPMTLNVNGDFEMQNPPPPAFAPPGFRPTADFSTTLEFPAIVALGYGAVLGAVRVEADVEWVQHSRNDMLRLDLGMLTPVLAAFGGSADLPQNWDDTWTVALAADWACCEHWVLRGGWTWLPSPVPDETFMPVLAEDDRNIFGLGAGYRNGRHAVDAAYSYSFQKDRKLAIGESPVPGTYETESHLAALTYTFEI